jgi:hypothetical protein
VEDNQDHGLVGSYVLVHPDVYFDSDNGYGYTGILREADLLNDRFYVDLGDDGEPRRFATDWLMVLKDRDAIFRDLTANMKKLAKRDIRDLYNICHLLDTGKPEPYQRALQYASANSAIRDFTLVTLEEQLAPVIRAAQEEYYQTNRGRGC